MRSAPKLPMVAVRFRVRDGLILRPVFVRKWVRCRIPAPAHASGAR